MTDSAPVPYEPVPETRLRVGDAERYEAATALGEHFAAGGGMVATVLSETFKNRDPYYQYGYESMKLILDGLAASGGTRAGLLGWLPTVQGRQSVLGTYGFDANGDTTLRTYGVYGVRGSSLVYNGAITAA